MSAPVVEENKTSREVYFPMPGLNWYDFHTYKRYEGGNRYNISNSPSDKVPLFIR